MQFWFVIVVPKYLRFATFWKDQQIMILSSILEAKHKHVFTSRPTSLLAYNRCVFIYGICVFAQYIDTVSTDLKMMCTFNSNHPRFSWTFMTAYSRAKWKSNGDKVSPWFRPLGKGNASHRFVAMQTLLYVSLKHSLISLTSFMVKVR